MAPATASRAPAPGEVASRLAAGSDHGADAAGRAGQCRARERSARVVPLTGLADRPATLAAVAAALDHPGREPVALLSCDLDGFAPVDDRLGTDVGDAVLAETVRRLRALLEPGDVLGRVGGDELLALRRGASSRAGVEDLAVRAIAAVGQPFVVGGTVVRCGLSVGIAVVARFEHPRPAVGDLLARAAGALSLARRAGGGRIVIGGRA